VTVGPAEALDVREIEASGPGLVGLPAATGSAGLPRSAPGAR
jgi:hypothetical protein